MEWLNKNPAILALIGLFLAQMAMNRAWQNQIDAKFDALSSEVRALQRQVAYNRGVLDTTRRAAFAMQPDASAADSESAEYWIEQWATQLLAETEVPPAVGSPRNRTNLSSRGRNCPCWGRIDIQSRPSTLRLTRLQQSRKARLDSCYHPCVRNRNVACRRLGFAHSAGLLLPVALSGQGTGASGLEFRSGFWINLHHILFDEAFGDGSEGIDIQNSTSHGQHDDAWSQAIEYYSETFDGKDLLRRDMAAIKDALGAVGSGSLREVSTLDPQLVEILNAAAPAY